ncbi:hypothetical protein L873DRAFT_1677904 [Choiromyces venosus 120613-1]|uniref:Uncharacterized protein n=1 Tax=Choiromyces venosus 120613-1 TaxID=1336337 RepID=A0A3N4JS03_9PEZI|nr:hypothetical protein L873DRAFT_1677904 [Choiromyces venosus 120613-1]
MDSGSPSRKHPRSDAFASAAASLAPPNKRRRTTVLCNPIPQNLLNGVSSPYAKYNRNAGSQTPAGTSSASGLTSAKQSDTHSITSSTGRSRLAEQIRSFAPKPLMSPFAARAALKSKSFSTSTLRYNTSAAGPSGRDSNGNSSRPSSRAGSVASAMSPPAPRPTSVIGGGLFTPAKPVATPSRRIHHPDFSFDNKPPPPSSFQFTANDSRANTPAVQSSGITSRAHTPVRRVPTRGSPSVSFSSRASPAGHRASPTENKARADSILGFFSSSLDKARQALAGNRADRLEEKRQREKEAIRKQMEEDERNRRAEIFKQELEREEMEMQEKLERIQERKRTREQEEIEKRQENEERAAEARKPSFLFSHMPTRKDAPADDGSSQEPDEGEYYENDEYEDEDPSRTYEEGEEEEYEGEEFEEDAEAEEEYEEDEEEASTVLRSHAIEDDEIEEVIEEFGSEPAEDSEGLDEAEMNEYDSKAEEDYEEGETEKDDTDTERIVDWKIPKVGKDEDPDRSLDSTVLLPSQPASFTNKRPVSPDNAPSDPEKTPVPEDRSRLPELPQESGARTRRGQSAEPKVFSRENSEEPEVRALRNRNVVVRRGRSVSVEPSADESDVGRVPKRTKRSYSTQPTAPSRDSSEEPEVRALRNRTVIVNRGRSASAEPSASETDTAGGRRKTRAAKAAVPEEPNTPKKRGKKAVELPLSSIKEAVAEDSPKKNARATRKK